MDDHEIGNTQTHILFMFFFFFIRNQLVTFIWQYENVQYFLKILEIKLIILMMTVRKLAFDFCLNTMYTLQ